MSADSPSFISFPRFYLGDPKLRAAVDGIEAPVKELHEMFFDVHPVRERRVAGFQPRAAQRRRLAESRRSPMSCA